MLQSHPNLKFFLQSIGLTVLAAMLGGTVTWFVRDEDETDFSRYSLNYDLPALPSTLIGVSQGAVPIPVIEVKVEEDHAISDEETGIIVGEPFYDEDLNLYWDGQKVDGWDEE